MVYSFIPHCSICNMCFYICCFSSLKTGKKPTDKAYSYYVLSYKLVKSAQFSHVKKDYSFH